MKKLILFFLIITAQIYSSAQLYAGASYGTFNIPAAEMKGFGPTLKIEYVGYNERQAAYLDFSYYQKNTEGNGVTIYDGNGMPVGYAEETDKHSYKHLQLGFKGGFGKKFNKKGFSFFLGGGIAVSFAKMVAKYTSPGYNIPDDKINRTIFGFHFNAGGQYNFGPVTLELKANFDLVLKPLVLNSSTSNVISASRLGILIPLTKE